MKTKTKEEFLQEVYSNQIVKDMLNSLNNDKEKDEILKTADNALTALYDQLMSLGQNIKNNPPPNLKEEIEKRFIITKDK